jgi:NitT/TauT family transport system ATP-binding protein
VTAPPAATPSLLAERVSLVYRTRRGSITALQDLSLQIAAGEFVALLGPSGCGKSTLLKIAGGLIAATGGSVSINGAPVTGPRRDVGIAFQKPTLMPWKTVLANVLLPAQTLKLDPGPARERALGLLALVGLEGFESNYPKELSGGMQQRVGLARMLLHDPAMLLMDEPFAALDAMTREALTLELQRIWMQDAKSVLFVTHSIPEAVFLADRVLVMSGRPGRIVEAMPIDLPRPRNIDTMAGAPFGALCDHLRRHFVAAPAAH